MQFRDVLERINFVPSVDTQRPSTEKEKRHVRAKGGGDFQHLRGGQFCFGELQVAKHCGDGIARASSKPSASRNSFLELDFHAATDFQLAFDCIHSAIYQILLDRFRGKHDVSLNCQ